MILNDWGRVINYVRILEEREKELEGYEIAKKTADVIYGR